MRRALLLLALLTLAAIVVVGLTQAGGEDQPQATTPTGAAAVRALAGAPPELARLHGQASELLGGGVAAYRARLRELRGWPVVVNKWASWCGPCRFEFPFFQSQAVALGRRVAFLGIDSGDTRSAAERFLRRFPVPFPSYEDPSERIARVAGAPANFPITIFYSATGERTFVHQGAFPSEAALAKAIRRYALRP